MSQGSHSGCSECADFLKAALEASRAYHNLLGDLESSHIRNDTKEAFRLNDQIAQSVLSRDNSITALRDHQRTHAKSAHGR